MKFSYRAFDKAGKAKVDVIEASSVAEATEVLRRQGLFASEVKPASEHAAAAAGGASSGRGGARSRNLASFTRQLAVLVRTGTPLVDAMQALEKQTTDAKWLKVISDVRLRVEEGQTLSEALSTHPKSFDSVCRSLVRAGESGGNLGDMLTRLSDLARKQLKIRQQLIGAMVYPCVLICVAIGVMTTMLLFVMPRFAGLFKSLEVPLPPTTKVLMSASAFLVKYWWAVVCGIGVVVGGLVWWIRTPAGVYARDTLLLRAPQVGRLMRGLGTARFARLMGVLLESKVPMLECLELTRLASPNMHYAKLIADAQESLQRGEPLSGAIERGGIIDPSVCEAVRSGERTGQVGPVLSSMADFIEEQNEVVIKSLTSLVEPLILISLGAIVGVMAISMFLPLFDLSASASAGGGGAGAGGAP
jgi:type II secretory pathway component PulF